MNDFQNKTHTILLAVLIVCCSYFIAETSDATGMHFPQQKKIKKDPKLAATLNNRGNSYFARANKKKLTYLDSAIVCYKKAMENDPSDAGIKFNLGLAYLAKGKTKQADSYFKQGLNQCKGNKEKAYKLIKINTKKSTKNNSMFNFLESSSFSKKKKKDKEPTKPAGPPSLNVIKKHLYNKSRGGK